MVLDWTVVGSRVKPAMWVYVHVILILYHVGCSPTRLNNRASIQVSRCYMELHVALGI